ncbi:MAG: methylated-DNA--[protein]-cysteine S-methyltransferase [Nitrospinae bacterium]|nr:methylated-DNA--[protein]-cysteine S-methyltransferase [Nitrospinota bacterium]
MDYIVFPGPLGLMGLAATPAGLCRVALRVARESSFRDCLEKTHRRTPRNNPNALKKIKRQFDLYFSGKLRKFSCPLDFGGATAFQKKIWTRLTAIPFGETRSYQWLAQAAGRPSACRAAGNANGKNPLPIVVPCHRVVRKNGELGGYSGGTDIKRFLLDLERSHAAL